MWKYFILATTGLLFLLFLWYLIPLERPPSGRLVGLSYNNLKNWSSGQQGLALSAFRKSCAVFLSEPDARKILPTGLGGRIRDWKPVCKAADEAGNLTDHQARSFFEQYFSLLSYIDEGQGLFTGYFAPEYLGSSRRTRQYRYPLYAVPADLKILDLGKFDPALRGKTIIGRVRDGTFVPYESRKNIDNGMLENRRLELVWLKDPVDVFFMQIQGSGVILYHNGDRKIFGYAGKNGQTYHSIGKFLIKSGDIPRQDMSLQAIRAWFRANPGKVRNLMWKNPSYVFFHYLKTTAPVGSMNVTLTPGRSVAVDPQYVPLGMPLWLDVNSRAAGGPLRRLVIAQDTGGAIKGRIRADIYWGMGKSAGQKAGPMKDFGRYYFLVPKPLATRILAAKGLVK